MTRSILLVAASGLAVCVAGCSALGLDELGFPDCETGCNTLNDRDSIAWDRTTMRPTACLAWRCDQSSGECRFGASDDDRDGHYSSQLCASVEGVEPADDCDDGDAAVVPGGTESCNGRDDDCSGIADDVFAARAAPIDVMTIRGTMPPTWARSVPLAPAGIAVSWDDDVAVGFAQIEDTSAPTSVGAPLAPFSQTAAALEPRSFRRDDELPIERGCPSGTFSRSARRRTCTVDADCGDPSEVCVDEPDGDRSFCEAALTYPVGYPTDGSLCLHDADCGDGVFCNGDRACRPTDSAVDARQCRAEVIPACPGESELCDEERLGCVVRMPGGCTMDSVAVTPSTDGHWLSAFVSATGCDEGVLRLGYFLDEDRADPVRYPNRNVLQRGDERRSTAYRGVDAGDEASASRCTGATRPTGAPIGASGVVTASLAPAGDRLVPQALVAFFAAPRCRDERIGCSASVVGGTGPVDVEVIGAWLENGRTIGSSSPLAWVNATGDGVPARLGAAAVGSGPALASFGDADAGGYVLAYAEADGGIAAHVIDGLADPSPRCTAGGPRPCVRDDGITDFGTLTDDLPFRTTAPLTVPAAVEIFAGAEPVGSVAMALGELAGGSIPVALAWPEASAIAMAVASLDPATGTITAGGSITRYDATGFAAGSLSMTYVATGIGSTAERAGGFVAAWATSGGTWAARLDAGGAALAPGRVHLGAEVAFPRAFVERVEEQDADGNVIRERDIVRVLGARPGSFVAFPAVCGAETES